MKQSILSQVVICPVCHKAYIPDSDVCNCPEAEEPRVSESSFNEVVSHEIK